MTRWQTWKRVDQSKCLLMYVIYEHPKDYPDRFVVRRARIRGPKVKLDAVPMLADDLEDARSCVPPDLIRLKRYMLDDPCIVEVWL